MNRSPDIAKLGACDSARLAQQKGINPPPHAYQPLGEAQPYMCGFPGCFATVAVGKTWHLEAA